MSAPEPVVSPLGRLLSERAFEAFERTKTKGEWTANRRNLRTALVLERMTHRRVEPPGKVRESVVASKPHARFHYECLTGIVTRDVGFVADNDIAIGCAPDAVVGDFEGLVSITCPLAATHLATLDVLRNKAANTPPSMAIPAWSLMQIRHEMYCVGAAWCDYVSYDASFPNGLQSAIIRVTREELDLPAYEVLVREFLAEVDEEYTRVMGMAS